MDERLLALGSWFVCVSRQQTSTGAKNKPLVVVLLIVPTRVNRWGWVAPSSSNELRSRGGLE
jgi:hypothetical protein